MPSLDALATFLVTAAIFAFIPGPAMLYAAAQTMAGGRWSGLMASLGLHLGGYVHVAAAAFGLAILLHAVPMIYVAMKFGGAVYLVWLGVSLFRSRLPESDTSILQPKTGRRAFLESAAVEIFNPKTAIFYLAFLPQFIDKSGSLPAWGQFLLLGTIVNLMFSAADIVAVFLAGAMMSALRQSNVAQRMVRRAGGTILVALGIHLAIQRS